MDERCPRCHAVLPPLDEAPAAFCGVCGLPQLRVSADAIAVPASVPDAEGTAVKRRPPHHRADWRAALNILLMASLVGALPPMLIPGAVENGLVGGMVLLISPVLTLGAITLYHRTHGRRSISGRLGARMGAVLGLLMGVWIAVGTGIGGFVLRYHYGSRVLETNIAQAMAAVPAQLHTAGPLPAETLAQLQSPEFRATAFLFGYVFTTVILLISGAIFGSATGAMLRARRQRSGM